MARPIKLGIEYFSLDVFPDEKVEYIETLYEAEGFYLWIKLLQRIYSSGYFIEWSKFQLASMKKRTGIEMDKIEEILASCLEVGLFNQELFDLYGIITSRGIQKRFYMAAQKRKEIEIVPEYILHDKLLRWFDDDNTEETPQEVDENPMSEEVNSEEIRVEEPKTESYSGINPEETPLDEELSEDNGSVSAEECRLNDVKSTQSKVKESKVKNSKVKRDKNRAPKVPKITYAENVLMTEAECQKLVDKHGQAATDWMIDALDNYKGAHGKKYASDYRAILSWVVGKYEDQKLKGRKSDERSEVNDSVEPDLAERDWNNF
ncbi:hypothetical protein SANA_23110 [Gottschalkiaceae bacterium SANA]|nr:hypothetical protein SANA_23110 [Gottschalkiaceae bacterium SANA]